MANINLKKSDYIWNYIGYGANMGINLILLPIVLYYLPSAELGLWYIFVSIGTFVTLLDFGFAPQIARHISYVYSGAEEIIADGLSSRKREGINYELFALIISTCRYLYLILSLFIFFILISLGLLYIRHVSGSIYDNHIIVAWFVYAGACLCNIYFSYLNSVFRGIGKFTTINQALLSSKIIQLIICLIGLALGWGLIAVSLAYFLSGLSYRLMLVSSYQKHFKSNFKFTSNEKLRTLYKIWHNSWKEGIIAFVRYLNTQANTILCSLYLSLLETAQYSITLQICTICSTFSMINFTTILPRLNQACLDRDYLKQRRLFSGSIVFYFFCFIFLTLIVFFFGNSLLHLFHSKTYLQPPLFILLSIYFLFEGNQSLCASFISASNNLIYYKAFFISSLGGIIGSFLLLKFTSLGIWGLVLAPIVIQALYNNWKWPQYVLRSLELRVTSLITMGCKIILKKFKLQLR